MTESWEAPDWKAIPSMEGFFFEMNQALCNTLSNIGLGSYDRAAKYMKRFMALVEPSGIFSRIRPQDKIGYRNKENLLRLGIYSRCDNIIKHLEQAMAGGKLNLKEILIDFSSIIFLTNMYYMYVKTGVDFAGSYKPAFDIYDKKGL